ncbi:hypothetical protein IAG44_26295 [Streptomyces roseirectus]|uniref:Uncharacterized protein n=1 Tax=Streptomyces roseirectus TaxID=2768066 RepID=A0A7H0IIH4_9ACTN|nr:hypothetical protein [Streptomyces roseirectus]QNP72590.1 hypothetical protein IAG44_26295 [Streptomyces roseirectus]
MSGASGCFQVYVQLLGQVSSVEQFLVDPAVIAVVGAGLEAVVRILWSASGRWSRRRIVARTFRFRRAGTVVEYRYRSVREDSVEVEGER